VQIASVQTLHARAMRTNKMPLPKADLIVVDESHRCLARTWKQIVDAYPYAQLLGMTATPVRSDGRGLGNLFRELVTGPSVAELIEQKYLVPTVYYAPIEPDLKGVKTRAGDWALNELAARVDRPDMVGDVVSHWHRLAQHKRTIVFATSVTHSLHIRDEFIASGVRAEHLDGTTDKHERAAILERLASGETEVVTNCFVLTEGVDAPSVECICLARPTRQLGVYLQMAGRGLRPAEGKDRSILLDHAGAVYRHGLLQDPIKWTLDVTKHADNPTHQARTASQFSKLVECGQCKALRTGGQPCPHCGFQPKRRPEAVVFLDGDLERVTKGKAKPSSYSPADRQRFYQQLMALRLVRNEERLINGKPPLKPTWAAAKYKDRFHSWPPFAWNDLPPAAAVSPEIKSWVRSKDIAFAKRMAKDRAA
jgi:DNA repair protein RadD